MLQLHEENRLALSTPTLQRLLAATPSGGRALEEHGNLVVDTLRRERADIARARRLSARLGARIDEALRTDAVEHMDEPDYPQAGKLAIAQGLHLLNWTTGSYKKFFALIEPILREVSAREGRPARVLELACGSGGFSFELAALAQEKRLAVEVTGSDIVPLYVERAAEKAKKTRSKACFQVLDALDMRALTPGAYDLIFIAQSVHHFSPGQLACMISEARRVARTAFVSVDGYRSVPMLGFVVGTAVLSCWPAMVHDAIISVRKFYGEAELELVARLGAPDANIRVARLWPINTTLTVRFDGAVP